MLKLFAIIVAWAVIVQLVIPGVNVSGWSGLQAQVGTDPFAGMPSAPSFPDSPSGGMPSFDNCTGWNLPECLSELFGAFITTFVWLIDIIVWFFEAVVWTVECIIDVVAWIGGTFVATIMLLLGASTFSLEDDIGNPISVHPAIGLILIGFAVLVWLLVADHIIHVIRGTNT